jgi:hypothetical protein
MPITGGAPIVLADVDVAIPPKASWHEGGTLLYNDRAGINRLADTGGMPELIIPAEPGEILYGPQLLPDGDSVLFSTTTDPNVPGQIVVASLATGERTIVTGGGAAPRYLRTGHLVYAAGNTLFAVAFDVETLSVTGAAVPVVQGIMRGIGAMELQAQYAVADNGTLVYIGAAGAAAAQGRELVWVDRNGREGRTGLDGRLFGYARVSPDGRRIATSIGSPEGVSLWVSDVERPVLSLVTNEIVTPGSVTWSRDAQRLIFPLSRNDGPAQLGWTLADGTGSVEPVVSMDDSLFISPGGRTPDGSAIVYTYGAGASQPSIGLLSLEPDDAGERDWRPLIDRATGASAASVSPTGAWVAYHADDTGQYGVYIERFPEMSGRTLVSDADGGWGARWSPDGSELFYRRLGDGAMMAVALQTTPELAIGAPEFLFDGRPYIPMTTPVAGGGSALSWDLAPDGRFLMIRAFAMSNADRASIVIVENWFEELNRLVPVD